MTSLPQPAARSTGKGAAGKCAYQGNGRPDGRSEAKPRRIAAPTGGPPARYARCNETFRRAIALSEPRPSGSGGHRTDTTVLQFGLVPPQLRLYRFDCPGGMAGRSAAMYHIRVARRRFAPACHRNRERPYWKRDASIDSGSKPSISKGEKRQSSCTESKYGSVMARLTASPVQTEGS